MGRIRHLRFLQTPAIISIASLSTGSSLPTDAQSSLPASVPYVDEAVKTDHVAFASTGNRIELAISNGTGKVEHTFPVYSTGRDAPLVHTPDPPRWHFVPLYGTQYPASPPLCAEGACASGGHH